MPFGFPKGFLVVCEDALGTIYWLCLQYSNMCAIICHEQYIYCSPNLPSAGLIRLCCLETRTNQGGLLTQFAAAIAWHGVGLFWTAFCSHFEVTLTNEHYRQ